MLGSLSLPLLLGWTGRDHWRCIHGGVRSSQPQWQPACSWNGQHVSGHPVLRWNIPNETHAQCQSQNPHWTSLWSATSLVTYINRETEQLLVVTYKISRFSCKSKFFSFMFQLLSVYNLDLLHYYQVWIVKIFPDLNDSVTSWSLSPPPHTHKLFILHHVFSSHYKVFSNYSVIANAIWTYQWLLGIKGLNAGIISMHSSHFMTKLYQVRRQS